MQISYLRAPPPCRKIVKKPLVMSEKSNLVRSFRHPEVEKKNTFQKSPGRNQQFGHFRAIRIHIGLGCCMQKVKFGFFFVPWNVGNPTFGNTAHWTLAPVHLYDYAEATRGILYDR